MIPNNILHCVIIDDEPLARKGLREYVEDISFLKCMGEYSSALDYLKSDFNTTPDFLLLDIEMPGLKGNEFLKSFKNVPKAIVVTAYPEYALEGYELDIIDYLVKPVSFPRFIQAAQKAKEILQKETLNESFIWIKVENAYIKLNVSDIFYISALQNYIQIHTKEKTYTILRKLKDFLLELPPHFVQCHKSYIINTSKILRIEGHTLYSELGSIPLSRGIRRSFLDSLIGE